MITPLASSRQEIIHTLFPSTQADDQLDGTSILPIVQETDMPEKEPPAIPTHIEPTEQFVEEPLEKNTDNTSNNSDDKIDNDTDNQPLALLQKQQEQSVSSAEENSDYSFMNPLEELIRIRNQPNFIPIPKTSEETNTPVVEKEITPEKADSKPKKPSVLDYWKKQKQKNPTKFYITLISSSALLALCLLSIYAKATTGQKSTSKPRNNALPATTIKITPTSTPATIISTEQIISPKNTPKAHCLAGSTDPSLAFDDNPNTAWICNRPKKIDGEMLTITIPYSVISAIIITPGFDGSDQNGKDQYNQYRKINKVSIMIDNKVVASQNFTGRTPTTISIPHIPAREIKIWVLKTLPPENYSDSNLYTDNPFDNLPKIGNTKKINNKFAISEIRILGKEEGN